VFFTYNKNMVEDIKDVSGRKYDADLICWVIPTSDHKGVLELIQFAEKYDLHISDTAKQAFEQLQNEAQEFEQLTTQNRELSRSTSSDLVLRAGLTGQLRPFQLAGVDYLLKNKRSFLA
jgi:hypothetical protein